jgi:tetratricopeptide (TPR) repeat protein
MSLPNQEDRIWLFFFEDEFKENVVYGKANQCHFRNKENHYYGDVFSKIIDPRVFFSRYGRKESLRRIFEVSGVFTDIKAVLELEADIETYISFSVDIPIEAQLEFLIILKEQGFNVIENIARIDHLCLENARQKGVISEEGHYIVLNACNENLHYSLYRLTEKVFVREGEECLLGMGSDLRGRALLEAVVNKVNKRQHFLQNNDEIEAEYLRLGQFVDQWIERLNRASSIKPFVIPNVTFSNAPFIETSVSLMKNAVDERTDVIVNDIVRAISDFVNSTKVPHENIKGILFLGNTFSNSQFEKSVSSHFVLSDNNIIRIKEAELASAVSVYERMDCSQFSAASKVFLTNAETERKRVENAIKEEENRKIADELRRKVKQEEKEAHEAENKYKEAMARVEEYERKEDYAQMRDWCEIALQHKLGDSQAKEKKELALRLLSEEKVKSDQYNTIIKRAKKSLEEGKYQDALSQSESALNVRTSSREAQRIHEEAELAIEKLQKVKDFLTRADLFIAQKSYEEAVSELEKALALDDSNKSAKERLKEIKQKQSDLDSMLESLKEQLKESHLSHDYSKAISICEKLIEVDPSNIRKWSETIQQFRNLEKEKAQMMVRLKSLADKIEAALWEEDWEKVTALCKQYLEIENDEKIRLKLEQAEAKLVVFKRRQEFQQGVDSVKALIVDKKWKSAVQLCCELQKTYPEEADVLRELRAIIFAGEEESERNLQGKEKLRKNPPIGFKRSEDDDFFGDDGESKQTRPARPAKQKKELKQQDDFDFPIPKKQEKEKEENDDFFNKTSLNATGRKKPLTNDDFDF